MNSSSPSKRTDSITYLNLPTGRLNVDVLRLIFGHVADRCRSGLPPTRSIKWITVGHVCRFWRLALLDMPELWARDILVFGTAGALDEILIRAQNLPLRLDFFSLARELVFKIAIEQIAPLIPRAEVLQCTIKTFKEQQTVLAHIATQPPLALHTLRLDVLQRPGSDYIPYPDVVYATCIEQVPIRCLELRNIFLRPPTAGCLTSWTMRCSQEWIHHKRLTIYDVLTALAHNPGLEKLVLIHAFREGDANAVASRVNLPALKALTVFQGGTPSVSALLEHLRLPNTALEEVSIFDTTINTAEGISRVVSSVFMACARSVVLNAAHTLRVECSEITQRSYVGIELESRRHYSLKALRPSTFTISFEPQQWLASLLEATSQIMRSLVGAQIPKHIKELLFFIPEEEFVNDEFWEMVLRPFSATETFVIADLRTDTSAFGGGHPIALFHALSRNYDDGPLLPRLHRLVTCAEETDGLGLIGVPRALRTFQRRIEMGMPIREVKFLGGEQRPYELDNGLFGKVSTQMHRLAVDLGVGVEQVECWEDVNGEKIPRGFEFVFHYNGCGVNKAM